MASNKECPIETKGEFVSLIKSLKRALDEGGLVQIKRTQGDVDIASLSEEGPWPDSIDVSFKMTSTGDEYSLIVETHHGAGGCWKRK
jgi:hypothetical protein